MTTKTKFLANYTVAIILLVLMGTISNHILAYTIVQLIALACLFLLNPRFTNVIIFVSTFIFGSAVEYVGVHNNVWTYTHSSLAGIPLWMPFTWGNIALFIANNYQFMNDLRSRK